MVDCRKFDGQTHFPRSLTDRLYQTGDKAVLAKDVLDADTVVIVRRALGTDGKNMASGCVECFPRSTFCLPKDHVINNSWNNMTTGYHETNLSIRDPTMVMWRNLRRGATLDPDVDASATNIFVASLPGPIGLLDEVCSTVSNLGDRVSIAKATALAALPKHLQGFDMLIVQGKPDYSSDNGVLVFVTHWRQVWELHSRCLDVYKRALRANLVHRAYYDFEKACFEANAMVRDLESQEDIANASHVLRDAVMFTFFKLPE